MKFVKTMKSRNKEIGEWGKLKELLKKYDVELAYLFGSYAEGETTSFSDIDIAVLFKRNAEKRTDALRVGLTELLGEEAIDLIDLEKAPPRLKYNVIKDGKIMLGQDRSTEFEAKAIQEYFDFRPLEEMYFDEMKERIESGKFGR